MTETRIGSDGLLEVKQDSLDAWVKAVVPLLVDGGWPIVLATAQATILNALKTNTDTLPLVSTRIQDLRTDVGLVRTLVQAINDVSLQAIGLDLSNTRASTSNIEVDVDTIRLALAGATSINALLQAANESLDTCEAKTTQIKTDTASLVVALAEVKTVLDQIQLNQNRRITTSPTITNLTLATANQQATYNIPAGTKRYSFKCRGDSSDVIGDIRYSWIINKVAPSGGGAGVDSYDILSSTSEEVSDDFFNSVTPIYFASATAGVVLSIRTWA